MPLKHKTIRIIKYGISFHLGGLFNLLCIYSLAKTYPEWFKENFVFMVSGAKFELIIIEFIGTYFLIKYAIKKFKEKKNNENKPKIEVNE